MTTCNTGRVQDVRPTPPYYDPNRKKMTGPGVRLDWNVGWPNNLVNWFPGSITTSRTEHGYSVVPSHPQSFNDIPTFPEPSNPIVLPEFELVSVPMNPIPHTLCFDDARLIPTPVEAGNGRSMVSGPFKDTHQSQMWMPDWLTPWQHGNSFLNALGDPSAAMIGNDNFGLADVAPVPGFPDNHLAEVLAAADHTTPEPMSKMISVPCFSGVRPVDPLSVPPSTEQQSLFDIPGSDELLATGRHRFDATELSNQWMEASVNQAVASAQASQNLGLGICGVTTPTKKQTTSVSARQPSFRVHKRSLGWTSSRNEYNKRVRQLSSDGRKNAAAMRKLGPCVRCRMYKGKCDENNPCSRCKFLANPRTWNLPCQRMNLKSIHVVRHGFGRFNQHDIDFIQYRWLDAYCDPDILSLEWFLPGDSKIVAKQMSLPIRRYVADALHSDTFNYHWSSNGEEKCIRVPPFACDDNNEVVQEIPSLLDQGGWAVEAWIMEHHKDDEIAQITYTEAKRFCEENESEVIAEALSLQRDAIMSQGVGSVLVESFPLLLQDEDCDDIRNCAAYDGEASGQERPIPMAVQHQIEVVILQGMRKKQNDLLWRLDQLIFQKKPKPWYEIFLAFFIVLKNMEWIYSAALGYKKRCEETVLQSQVNGVIVKMVEEYENAATVMLYHFRCILQGHLPFQLARDNPSALQADLHIDQKAADYLKHLVRLLVEQHMMEAKASGGSAYRPGCARDGRWICELFRDCFEQ